MRENKPSLTSELIDHCKGAPVWRAPAFEITTYRILVEHIARLAYANPDILLFFRGQDKDYQSKAGGTTLYPAIYRGDSLAHWELDHRFRLLDQASKLLVTRFGSEKIDGYRELRQKQYIQWSILQHYEVVPTPLIDLTQSIRVACSFAQLWSTDPICYVYVVGLPYLTNRISINSEHDIVNIRLLSICPPSALRPYFQEGYLAGTTDITSRFDSKTVLDFRNRLVAKFAIPRAKSFWGAGFEQIPKTALFPKGDRVHALCDDLKDEIHDEFLPVELGEFIRNWARIEEYLLKNGRRITERNLSVREAISALASTNQIKQDQAELLESIRSFRNTVVHQPSSIKGKDLREYLEKMSYFSKGFLEDAG